MKQKNSKLVLCVLSALLLVGCATSTSSNQPTTSSQETTSSATTSKPQSSITKTLTGIEISKMPKKVNYEEGDIFDKSGLEVKAKYSDNKDEIIKDYSIDKENTPLKLEDKERFNIGKYGLLRPEYIKKYKLGLYFDLLVNDNLNEYLHNIDTTVMEKVQKLIKELAEKENITEELKSSNQMLWIDKMNNIKNIAEEIILKEYIYV